MIAYLISDAGEILTLTLQHLQLSLEGIVLAGLLGVPLGLWLTRRPRWAGAALGLSEMIQTVPSLALLALLMMVFGLGNVTLVLALVLYSLLPIIRNTYVGATGVPAETLEAARGVGMTELQVLRRVQLPLAAPVILAGFRIALVTAIGIATIGVLIGAGGLGALLYRGIQTLNDDMVLAGAIPAALLAVVCDLGLALMEKKLIS